MNCRPFAAAALVFVSLVFVSLASAIRADEKSEFARSTIDLGVVVGDVAKSVKFYTEAIGFTEAPGFKVDGPYTADVGLTDGSEELDIHVLVLGDEPSATKLKLMQFKKKPKADDNTAINSQLGFRYLTIFVNDTNAAVARLKKAGVSTLAKSPQPLPKGLPQDVYLTLVRDPDGNLVELVGPKK
jgi:catechol 2,3-dioxygenase-like lactoylglutathione lyase family enzyme